MALRLFFRLIAFPGALLLIATNVIAAEARIAVATNFLPVAEALAVTFEEETGHRITLISGSTGKLTAQIERGAPFDVFLAADQARPAHLAERGAAVEGSIFTYASGTLSLWSANAERLGWSGKTELEELVPNCCERIAIANPRLAPYGRAAQQVLDALGADAADKLVTGENAGQAFALAASGAADIALIPTALMLAFSASERARGMPVPSAMHDPILQDAALLKHGQGNEAAIGFLSFLASEDVQQLLVPLGFGG